jgi:tetratricopeptide (TPR) repeat protein
MAILIITAILLNASIQDLPGGKGVIATPAVEEKRATKPKPRKQQKTGVRASVHTPVRVTKVALDKNEVETYRQRIEKFPEDPWAHFNLAYTYYKSGHYKEASEHYQEGLRIKPDYVLAQYNLGHAQFELGRYKEAIQAFLEAIKLEPNHTAAHMELVMTYSKMGNRKAAQEQLEALRAFNPSAADELKSTYNY